MGILNLSITSDRSGWTERGKLVPAGTVVEYRGHVAGGAIRVSFADGSVEVMSHECFPGLRAMPPEPQKRERGR